MTHIIGIDLGTTNSTMAFSSNGALKIEQFAIEQRIAESMVAKKTCLPSFYFFPLQEEDPSIGWHARESAAQLPDRIIASAKSWLCHDLIDRRSSFLPLGDFETKKSPLEVSAAFLRHLRSCFEKELQEVSFSEQKVIVTVPASFDPSARELVVEAAHLAGFPEIRLMEEPLAAFYAWLYNHQESWRDILKVGDTVLVVDIGGGTSDFSLITVSENAGELTLERKAVGNHLLLGGDNFDLALAHFAAQKFSTPLDDWQFQSLIHSCRQAKEKLLGQNPPEQIDLTIQGRGSRLIGGSLNAILKREEVEHILVEGFFPIVDLNEPIVEQKRSALANLGLPFARDPRITAQLAHFLNQFEILPTAVLFNGGTMKSAAFQERILSLLSLWKKEEVKELEGGDLDFGVSLGAVYYGFAHANKGIRVRAATCKSYYIGVESAAPAIPGISVPIKKVPLVPFGMEEGTEITLENQKFSLLLEEPAFFRFFSKNAEHSDEFVELHPIETVLHAQGDEGKIATVKLTAKLTELGLLELWCVSEDGRKWKLSFDTRNPL